MTAMNTVSLIALGIVAEQEVASNIRAGQSLCCLDTDLLVALCETHPHLNHKFKGELARALRDHGNHQQAYALEIWAHRLFSDTTHPCAACQKYGVSCRLVNLVRAYKACDAQRLEGEVALLPLVWHTDVIAELVRSGGGGGGASMISAAETMRALVDLLCAIDTYDVPYPRENLCRAVRQLKYVVDMIGKVWRPLELVLDRHVGSLEELVNVTQAYHNNIRLICGALDSSLKRVGYTGNAAPVRALISHGRWPERNHIDEMMQRIFAAFRVEDFQKVLELLLNPSNSDVLGQFRLHVSAPEQLPYAIGVWGERLYHFLLHSCVDTTHYIGVTNVLREIVARIRRLYGTEIVDCMSAFHVTTINTILRYLARPHPSGQGTILETGSYQMREIFEIVPRIRQGDVGAITDALDAFCKTFSWDKVSSIRDTILKCVVAPDGESVHRVQLLQQKQLLLTLNEQSPPPQTTTSDCDELKEIRGKPLDCLTLRELCLSMTHKAQHVPTFKSTWDSYNAAFATQFLLTSTSEETTVHETLNSLNQLILAYACMSKVRPLGPLTEEMTECYNSLLTCFLADIVLSTEGVRAPCQCCGEPYEEFIKVQEGIEDKVVLSGENASKLRQLYTLIMLPLAEQEWFSGVTAETTGPEYDNLWSDEEDDGLELCQCDDDDVSNDSEGMTVVNDESYYWTMDAV